MPSPRPLAAPRARARLLRFFLSAPPPAAPPERPARSRAPLLALAAAILVACATILLS